MSTFENMPITCGHCGGAETHEVAKSINGPRAPEVVEAILSGTFQRFTCTHCEQPYVVEHPLVFIDFDASVWIYMYPREWEARWATLEVESRTSWRTNMIDNAPPIVREASGGFRLRTVFGLRGLQDKLICFESGLDDVTLELLKLDLLRSTPGLIMHPECRPALMAATAEEIVFQSVAREGDTQTKMVRMSVPRSRYEAIREDPVAWSAVHRRVSAGNYIDLGRIMLAGSDEDTAVLP